jgi:hypothetical protein
MPGVFCKRPTKYEARKQQGQLFFGVCIGDPKQVVPEDNDEIEIEIEKKTGVKPPPNFGAGKPMPDKGAAPKAKAKNKAKGAGKKATGKKPGKK